MGVIDGQAVSAGVTNPAFLNKNVDDVMPNQLGFVRPMSGPSIADIQKAVNSLYTASGVSEVNSGTQYNATPSTVPNGTNYQTAIQILAGKFSPTTGHFHTGAPGDGPALGTAAISNSPTFPLPVAASGVLGTSGSGFAWGNHQHQGVHSILVGVTALYGDITLTAGSGMQIAVSGQTITLSATGAVGGGGGGGSLQWVESASAPTPLVEFNMESYLYGAGLTQFLYAQVDVPSTYVPGSPIKLRSKFYSPDTSGTVLMQTNAILIRTGIDAASSLANQRTSTNMAVTLSVTNVVNQVVFDLTDSTGNINGVAVSPGDTVLIALRRGGDTATSDVRALVFDSTPTFS